MKAPVDRNKQHSDLKFGIKGLFSNTWIFDLLMVIYTFLEFFLIYPFLIMKAPVDRTKQDRDLTCGIKGL